MQRIPSSVKYKKRFLRWFLNTQLTEENDVTWFLEDLLVDDQALSRLRFVEKLDQSPKGIIISTLPEDEPFIFFKGSVQSDNVYTAYHELQLYDDELFYVQIKFPRLEHNRLYQMLLREERTAERKNKAIATHLLNHLLKTEQEALIREKIDWALDTKNEAMFHHYVKELKDLTEELS
mgnify:CR=1 FL=1